MTELESIIKKLDEAKRVSALDSGDPQFSRTRSGIETAIANAKVDLKALSKEYGNAVLKNGVAIFLFGPNDKTKTFADLVTAMGEAVVVDASEMYERLADACEKTMGSSREFTAPQTAMLQARLIDIAHEVNVNLSSFILVKSSPVLATHQSVVEFIRGTIRHQLGDALCSEYIKRTLARKAEEIRYMLSVAPVIVVNSTPDEFASFSPLFGKGFAGVNIDPETTVDQEYITNTFQTVQQSLKKK